MMVFMQIDDNYNSVHSILLSQSRGVAMGHSQASKASNRERILNEASARIRETGLESLSVGKLMQSVNLTHGGFYGHFASRKDLLAEALAKALQDGEETAKASNGGAPRNYPTLVRGYLSRTHRDSREAGCAIAALVSDAGRAEKGIRAVMGERIERYLTSIASSLGDEDEERAMVALSTLVGALALSRVVNDSKKSDAVLRAAREHLLNFEK